MPAWQIVLIVAALVAAAFVVAIVVRLWRDPYALVRAEFARERMALGFARRTIDVDGIRRVYAAGGSRDAAASVPVMQHGFTARKENMYRAAKHMAASSRPLLMGPAGRGESAR